MLEVRLLYRKETGPSGSGGGKLPWASVVLGVMSLAATLLSLLR